MSNLSILTAEEQQVFDYPPALSVEIRALYFTIDQTLDSSGDGSKFNVNVDSLIANASFKYHAKDKGVRVYALINDMIEMIKNDSVLTWHHIILYEKYDFSRLPANDFAFNKRKILAPKVA